MASLLEPQTQTGFCGEHESDSLDAQFWKQPWQIHLVLEPAPGGLRLPIVGVEPSWIGARGGDAVSQLHSIHTVT